MKIGILGGSFNPVHIGHLILAERVCSELSLDRIFFVPCNIPPHKPDETLVPARARLRMVAMAIRGNPCFDILDCEIKRGGVSYTVDTLEDVRKTFPGSALFLIVGSDLCKKFHTWKDPQRIKKIAHIVTVTRGGTSCRLHGSGMISIPRIEVSSSLIRQCIKEGTSIRYLVPDAVKKYIEKKKLYR